MSANLKFGISKERAVKLKAVPRSYNIIFCLPETTIWDIINASQEHMGNTVFDILQRG